jgi:hypothetical protein
LHQNTDSSTGSDVWKRIAAPMVGGILTSFILELVVYPALYEILEVALRGERPRRFTARRARSPAVAALTAGNPLGCVDGLGKLQPHTAHVMICPPRAHPRV